MLGCVKTITMYLPQFHVIPENDEWWGKNYTEWTAVKCAVPLFKGHNQPKVPLNENYYDLTDKETMLWQSRLMKKYGIDGQCFYHYYFKDGRLILERPAENLLRWKDVDMPFCFCWDHHNWVKTWSAVSGNSWADKFEKREGATSEGLLLEQRYGGQEVWRKHFMYLLPFFKDERYIRCSGRPVFLIHGPGTIYCLAPMITYWRMLAEENGIHGLYVIGENAESHLGCLDAVILRAPHMFWKLKNGGDNFRFNYDEMWNHILNAPAKRDCKTYFGGIADYDDTPRRGKNGIVAENFSINKFQNYMCKLYKKSLCLKNEFLFINAWNEWGEGMYLEPDEEHGYAYLEAVKEAQELADKTVWEYPASLEFESVEKKYNILMKNSIRDKKIYRCMDRWMQLWEKNISLSEYLIKKKIDTIAVYGIGILGRHFVYEMEHSEIEIKYLIDRKARKSFSGYRIVKPSDELEAVDVVVVTAINDFEEIYEALKEKVNAQIVSLEELVYEI